MNRLYLKQMAKFIMTLIVHFMIAAVTNDEAEEEKYRKQKSRKQARRKLYNAS